jgi:hypothetical protein
MICLYPYSWKILTCSTILFPARHGVFMGCQVRTFQASNQMLMLHIISFTVSVSRTSLFVGMNPNCFTRENLILILLWQRAACTKTLSYSNWSSCPSVSLRYELWFFFCDALMLKVAVWFWYIKLAVMIHIKLAHMLILLSIYELFEMLSTPGNLVSASIVSELLLKR